MGVDRAPIHSKHVSAEVVVDFNRKVIATSDYCLTKNDAIREAEYLCIIKNGIDVIVDPIFKLEYAPTELKRKHRATVIGFAGVYKKVPTGVDAVVGYDMEDVEKYKMLTDPSFPQHYYNQSVGNTYYVNTRKVDEPEGKVTVCKSAEVEKENAAPLTKKQMKKAEKQAKKAKKLAKKNKRK